MNVMTERTILIQARVLESDARRLDADAYALGLTNRSAAIREAMRLLHRRARHALLALEYDTFYGEGSEAPLSDVTAIGDEVASSSIAGQTMSRSKPAST